MFTNIFDHAVIFQQYDVDLPPEDKLGIFISRIAIMSSLLITGFILSPLTLTMLQSGLMKGTSILPITKSSVNMRSRAKLPAVTSRPYTFAPFLASGIIASEGRVNVRI